MESKQNQEAGDKSAQSVNVEAVPAAVSKEHNLTLKQGLRAYRKAIGWSVLLSMAVIMEGYGECRVMLLSVSRISNGINQYLSFSSSILTQRHEIKFV